MTLENLSNKLKDSNQKYCPNCSQRFSANYKTCPKDNFFLIEIFEESVVDSKKDLIFDKISKNTSSNQPTQRLSPKLIGVIVISFIAIASFAGIYFFYGRSDEKHSQDKAEASNTSVAISPNQQSVSVSTSFTSISARVKTKDENRLILRSQPNRNSSEITRIQDGSSVVIVRYTNTEDFIDGKSGKWCQIKYGDYEGFAWGGYLVPVELPLDQEKLTTRVQSYLDKNYSGWKLEKLTSNSDCFNEFKRAVIKGDFDGDGKYDCVVRIIRGNEGYIIAFLERGTSYEVHVLISGVGIQNLGLSMGEKGKHDNVVLQNDAPLIGECGSEAGYYIYKNGKFN